MKRFFECLLPVTSCNLKCSYCYVIQEGRRKMQLAELPYSPEHIAKALRAERVGGVSWISICGAGETLIQEEVVEIVRLLLLEGHYINITTNGTLTNRFDQIIEACGDSIKRLHFSFSLHYLELKRLNLLDTFFDNIKKVKKAGASFVLQINLVDEYVPYIEEIKERSLSEVGAFPQVALTRDESTRPMKILSSLSDEEYYLQGRRFESELFEFTYKNFNVKRNEFCYAGDWSGVLNLQTGWLSKCYANTEGQNIFADINEPIHFEAIGKHCRNYYCINSSHFMSLGIIPSIASPSYADLRNRRHAGWYNDEMEKFLNEKLYENNSRYGLGKQIKIAWKNNKNEKNRLKAVAKDLLPTSITQKF